MTLLEQRYRFVLRMLPASYRAEREEEMVDAFLDGAERIRDEDNARPSWREIASVAALAIRVRAGGLGAAPRYREMGDAVRLVALLGLGYHAVLGWYGVAATLVSTGVVGDLDPEYVITDPARLAWELASTAAGLVAVAAFATLALGRVRAARILTWLSLLHVVVMTGLGLLQVTRVGLFMWERTIIEQALYLLAMAAPGVALLIGYHEDAPVRRSPLLAVLPLGLTALYLTVNAVTLQRLTSYTGDGPTWVAAWTDLYGLSAIAVGVAGVHCLVRRASPAWGLALAAVAMLLGLMRAPLLPLDAESIATQPLGTTMIAQFAALLLLAAALAVVSVRSLPRAARASS
ncbi:hypothetical protein ACFXJ8_10385 [Nonomuraea sp. NPDC059194]|uniref:hypothetical protein n=1 Tax=Nonomuraea sp. NPDC059194 TaxID=3346764 RepID=UPI0036C1213D